jgi:Ca2+-binding RTX toxin-like protein
VTGVLRPARLITAVLATVCASITVSAEASAAGSCSFVPRTGVVTITAPNVGLGATRSDGTLWWRGAWGNGPWKQCSWGAQVATLPAISVINVRVVNDALDDAALHLDLRDIDSGDDALSSGLEHETILLSAPEPWLIVAASDEPSHFVVGPDTVDFDDDGAPNVIAKNTLASGFYPFVDEISILWLNMGRGNDVVDVHQPGAGAKVDGGGGNDFIVGSDEGDDFAGGAGNDVIEGFGGNDDLAGGPGDDWLYGGDDQDDLLG